MKFDTLKDKTNSFRSLASRSSSHLSLQPLTGPRVSASCNSITLQTLLLPTSCSLLGIFPRQPKRVRPICRGHATRCVHRDMPIYPQKHPAIMTHFSRRMPGLHVTTVVVLRSWDSHRSVITFDVDQSIPHRDGTFTRKARALNQPMRRAS